MKRFFILLIVAATLGCGVAEAVAQQAPVQRQGQSYEAFRMVRTRNVFDPERKANAPQNAGQSAATPAATQGDFVALTGTMVTADKALAFFSGSRADFNKVLPSSERIAGATITKITASNIEVERDGKRFTIAVGQTVPLDNNAVPAAAPAPVANPDPEASTAGNNNPADKDEVLRRLMERRQQELK